MRYRCRRRGALTLLPEACVTSLWQLEDALTSQRHRALGGGWDASEPVLRMPRLQGTGWG